jgi:transmembrane sensor
MSEPRRDAPALARDEQAAAWAARLAEGPLDGRDAADFESWLAADEANGPALDAIVETWAAVESYAAAPELVALRGAALEAAHRAHRRRWFRSGMKSSLGRPWIALAASIVLVVAAALLWAGLRPTAYETGVGERRVISLSDGSKLSLDAETRVRVRYAGGARRLWLDQGRAKFEVAKDPLRPFSVEAADKTVVATGTAFSVELLNRQVRVVLYEGHVAVLEEAPDGSRRPVTLGVSRQNADRFLTPGHELVTTEASAPAAVAPVQIAATDPVRSLSWEGGELVFEDEPLPLAVERMNRYAAKPLRIGDPAAASVRISGVFRAGDETAFLSGLQAAFGVRARDEGGTLVLRRSGPPL